MTPDPEAVAWLERNLDKLCAPTITYKLGSDLIAFDTYGGATESSLFGQPMIAFKPDDPVGADHRSCHTCLYTDRGGQSFTYQHNPPLWFRLRHGGPFDPTPGRCP